MAYLQLHGIEKFFGEVKIDEAGASDFDALDTPETCCREFDSDPVRQIFGIDAGLLGACERDIGRIVAIGHIRRSLEYNSIGFDANTFQYCVYAFFYIF